jgi:hypothetical protein
MAVMLSNACLVHKLNRTAQMLQLHTELRGAIFGRWALAPPSHSPSLAGLPSGLAYRTRRDSSVGTAAVVGSGARITLPYPHPLFVAPPVACRAGMMTRCLLPPSITPNVLKFLQLWDYEAGMTHDVGARMPGAPTMPGCGRPCMVQQPVAGGWEPVQECAAC